MVLTTIILWDLACDADDHVRDLEDRVSADERIQWIVVDGSECFVVDAANHSTVRDALVRGERKPPEAVGLNAAVRAAKGRNLVFSDRIRQELMEMLPELETFLAANQSVIGVVRGVDGGIRGSLERHLRGFSGCSSLPALFAGNGIVCARRSIFSAREAFSSNVPRSLVWSDLVFSHLAHGGKSSGSRIVRFWSNAAFLPGTEQDEIRPGHGPSPADWGCYVEAKDRIEFHLTRNLVERVLRGGLEPAEELDLLGRIEAIFQCCAELVPARRTLSYLAEAKA